MTLATHVFNADDEYGRQCALDRFNILDTEVESEFEEITSLVSTCLNAPIAGVSLIDKARLWYKSLQGADVKEAVRDTTFCDHTIRSTRHP